MYKNVLQAIDNIAIWPVVSFVIFFVFFIILLWWVFSVDNSFINKMKALPMDGEPGSESTDPSNGKQE
jgi:cytochrome c oxidase cbb3-type subunit 4